MTYNPYDLLQLCINGTEIYSRPIAFDSEVANSMTMTNASGGFVKPTQVSTICPDCGGGLVLDLPNLQDPPYPVLDFVCENCHPDAPEPINPFMNPLDEKIRSIVA